MVGTTDTVFDLCQDWLNYPSLLRRRGFTNKKDCDSEVVVFCYEILIETRAKDNWCGGNQRVSAALVGTPMREDELRHHWLAGTFRPELVQIVGQTGGIALKPRPVHAV